MPHSRSRRPPDLERYRQMRDPSRTPEPFGDDADPRSRAANEAGVFVVQQHAARALHWDLRLEIEGVLASWAVPKGPSLDPRERRLAVHTEDHPLAYADFEGVIPEGNYGAGAMIVWDRGRYRKIDGSAPAEGVEAGKLDLVLEGYKLRGRFALVRTKRGSGRDWLLIHKADGGPVVDIVAEQPASVLSGLTVEELRADGSRAAELADLADRAGARRAELSTGDLRPMLAEQADAPFSSPAYLFEPKLDGVRARA
jgi:bifunctional non-homologous end joining protein LigD